MTYCRVAADARSVIAAGLRSTLLQVLSAGDNGFQQFWHLRFVQ
jgi:hypothetical protein